MYSNEKGTLAYFFFQKPHIPAFRSTSASKQTFLFVFRCNGVSGSLAATPVALNSISAPPVRQHHDNDTLQATFTTGCPNVRLKTFSLKTDRLSVYLWAVSECCKILYTIWKPQTGLIDNSITRNCMVMVTSAAKRSIRRDLQRRRGVVRPGTRLNNYPSSFPRLFARHTSLF